MPPMDDAPERAEEERGKPATREVPSSSGGHCGLRCRSKRGLLSLQRPWNGYAGSSTSEANKPNPEPPSARETPAAEVDALSHGIGSHMHPRRRSQRRP